MICGMTKYNYLHGAGALLMRKGYTFLFRLQYVMLTIILACGFSYGQNQIDMKINSLTLPNDITMEYTEHGEGSTTYLFLHGLGSNLKAYTKLIGAMGSDVHTVAVNYPQTLDSFSLKAYADMLASFINDKDLDNVVIVGHSMGAQVAMHLVIMYPDISQALVLIAPAGIETFSEADKAWFAQYVTKEHYKALTPERIKYSFDINFFGAKLPEDAGFMYEDRMAVVNDPEQYDLFLDYYLGSIWAMLREPVIEDVHAIDQPVLVMFGQDDLLIPNRILHPGLTTQGILESAGAAFKNSTTELIEECGHFAIWDQPETIAQLILKFY